MPRVLLGRSLAILTRDVRLAACPQAGPESSPLLPDLADEPAGLGLLREVMEVVDQGRALRPVFEPGEGRQEVLRHAERGGCPQGHGDELGEGRRDRGTEAAREARTANSRGPAPPDQS